MAYESLYTGEQIDEAVGKVLNGEVSPQGGVKTFNGRTGNVTPQSGDYTPEQVGALPSSGGTLTGDLQIQVPEDQPAKIAFGDSEKAYISGSKNNTVKIYGDFINIATKYNYDGDITINGKRLELNSYAKKENPIFNYSISMGRKPNSDVGALSVALGEVVEATNDYASAFGYNTKSSGYASHAEGESTVASGAKSHAEGVGASAAGDYSHAEGGYSKATGPVSHAEGEATTASGYSSHAEGNATTASGLNSHAEGMGVEASGDYSHAANCGTIAAGSSQTAIGQYNISSTVSSNKLIIGKGSSFSSRANCFRATDTGVYASGNYNASGADYSEMFEWADGNPEKEDRVGRFVTMQGEQIMLAQPETDFVLGIVSGNPSIVGDVHDDQWRGMYLYDVFGRPLWEDVEVPDTAEHNVDTITKSHMEHRQKLNPDYDNTQIYLPRSKRPEWVAVGMLGKLVAVDDGTCVVDGWCKVGQDGIATYSDSRTKYRVMARVDENHIKVLML